jgi:predicted nucleic acid-binding protein
VITAVDTNVLLDVLGGDATFGPASATAVRRCLAEGGLIACDVVWAELRCFLADDRQAQDLLGALGVSFSVMTQASALSAGQTWQRYRRRGGKRERMAADFLIGAHAAGQADRLLTRDRGFYRSYFAGLRVLDPGTP